MLDERENWTSRAGFVLAAAGSAVGLGNIWRFTYVAGENGGAIFLLIYLLAIIVIGYPVMVTEVSLGRKSRRNPVGAFKELAPDSKWWLVGSLGVLCGFVILSFYSVVAGWSMAYIVEAVRGFGAQADYAAAFVDHISSPGTVIGWHAGFMLLTLIVIAFGVVKGIQRVVKVLMPLLLIILLVLVGRSVTLEGAGEGILFFLRPDLDSFTLESLGAALGQAFFTLSLGMGAMITYGSYLSDKDSVNDSAGYIVGLDTLIAIISGFAIFPAVFALGIQVDSGPNLAFITLPEVFARMPMGSFFGFLFFLLLSIAALTSAISLLEVVTAWLVDEKKWSRKKASLFLGALIFLCGIPPILGYSTWEQFEFLGMDILDTYEWVASDLFLPLGGMLTCIFAGHIWGTRSLTEEANKVASKINVGSLFGVLLKYIIPVVIFIVLVINIVDQVTPEETEEALIFLSSLLA